MRRLSCNTPSPPSHRSNSTVSLKTYPFMTHLVCKVSGLIFPRWYRFSDEGAGGNGGKGSAKTSENLLLGYVLFLPEVSTLVLASLFVWLFPCAFIRSVSAECACLKGSAGQIKDWNFFVDSKAYFVMVCLYRLVKEAWWGSYLRRLVL